MKNKLFIVLAVFWFIIALLLVGLLINRISGKHTHILFNSEVADKVFADSRNNITIDDLSTGDINTLYKSYSFSVSEVDAFFVEIISAGVYVEPYEGYDISVGLYGNWNAELEPEVKLERGKLSIKKPDIHIMNWNNLGSRKVVIKVPESSSAKRFDADLSSISGSIHVSDLSFKEVDVNSTSGSVHIDGTVNELTADTVSGSIHVNGSCGNLNCNSVSGGIHVETKEPLKGKNMLNTISGSINLTIPESDGFEFEWNTVSGSVNNEFYRGKCGKSGSQIIGDGNTRIIAETVSGSIHVNMN